MVPYAGLKYCNSINYFFVEYHAYLTLDVVNSYSHRLKDLEFSVVYFDVKDEICNFHVKED